MIRRFLEHRRERAKRRRFPAIAALEALGTGKGPSIRREIVEDITEITSPVRPHGDYGRILFDGLRAQRGIGAPLQICRTAQGCPDLSFPGPGIAVVNEKGRARMERLGLDNLAFVDCPVKHVVDLDWTGWDFGQEQLPEYGSEGEPKNYILDRPPRPDMLEMVGPLWAVSSQDQGLLATEVERESDPYAVINAMRAMLAERSPMLIWSASVLGYGGLLVGSGAKAALNAEFGDEIGIGPWATRILIPEASPPN